MEKSTQAITGTQAVSRASVLLVHVLEAERSPLLTELALAHGLAKSTTSRLLGALERAGLVQRDRDGAFQPGSVLTKFARTRGGEADLAARFHPVLERLSQSTGETANLAIAGHGAVDLIDQVDGHYLLGAKNWIGTNVPLHNDAERTVSASNQLNHHVESAARRCTDHRQGPRLCIHLRRA
jgi:IclR family acetate operon transcriptional repressor